MQDFFGIFFRLFLAPEIPLAIRVAREGGSSSLPGAPQRGEGGLLDVINNVGKAETCLASPEGAADPPSHLAIHVARDMSPRSKARTCPRTPNRPPEGSRKNYSLGQRAPKLTLTGDHCPHAIWSRRRHCS